MTTLPQLRNPALGTRTDLSECDTEPVRIPGAIQPHGALLVLDPVDLRIVGVSDNAARVLHKAPGDLLGRGIAAIAGGGASDALVERLRQGALEGPTPCELITEGGAGLEVVAHQHDGRILVEFEPTGAAPKAAQADTYRRVRGSLARLRSSSDLRDLCERTAREMRELTGFDRVIVYRFKPDWSGEVVAEACPNGDARYMGLRFPASDIPSQARALYTACRVRMVPTSSYTPARILGPGDGRPVDLTFASLRSISPVHLEYMRNMGVTASLGISLLCDDRLWGLITCNHESGERFLPYEARAACSLLGEVVSSLIHQRESVAAAAERATYLDVQARLVRAVVQGRDVARGLTEHSPSLLDVTASAGAAFYYQNEIHCVGRTPSREAIGELLGWVEGQATETLVVESLPERYAPALAWKDTGCGLLATTISFPDSDVVSQKNWLLWFRPEVIQTVSWGGDPSKQASRDTRERLHPRTSFDRWREEVHLKAVPFAPSEVAAAKSLALGLTDVILEIEASRQIRAHSLLLDASNGELRRQIEENEKIGRALTARTEQLRQRERSLQLVLDATGEGFISVAPDGALLAERSRAFEQWFAIPPAPSFIWDVLFDDAEQRGEFEFLWKQLASDRLPFEVSVDQMCREFTRGGRCFEIGYAAVREGRALVSVLVTLEDVTEQAAARRLAREAAEAQAILASALRDAGGFGRTLAELAALSKAAAGAPSPASARRSLHTLKGSAAVLGLETLARLCHELEDRLAAPGDDRVVSASDLREIDDELARVAARVRELAGEGAFERVQVSRDELAGAIRGLERGEAAAALADLRRWTLEPAARPLHKLAALAQGLARKLEKSVEFVVEHGEVRVNADAFEPLWGALSHAIRNAIDHGIEPEPVRLGRGKSARGRVVLSARSCERWVTLEVGDDGAGVDLEAIRAAARARGLPSATREELLDALFAADLSTRAEVTMTSGRGVGLSALRETCLRLGGTIDVDTQPGVGTTLRVRVPVVT